MNRRRLLQAGAAAGTAWAAAALAGCVNVPDSGSIERADAGGQVNDPQVEIDVDPPQPGATPTVLVAGFLESMADYQPDYAVARQFLADEVRDTWRPESGAQIVGNDWGVSTGDDTAVFSGLQIGTLGADDTWSPARGELRLDLGLRRNADGEWRIGKPPPGLLMTEFNFERFYTSLTLYFFDPGFEVLVPAPIWLPRSNLSVTTAMQKLLRGPAEWLRPAVVSAFPDATTLIAAPVDAGGVAEIPLTAPAQGLNEDQRSRLAAQTVWTLRQIAAPRVTGVRFLVDGTPYVVRGAVQQVVPIDAFSGYSPVPAQQTTQLYGAAADGVVRVDDGPGRTPAVAVDGAIGGVGGALELAVNSAGSVIAVVTDERARLRRAEVGGAAVTDIETGLSRIELIQFTRWGELIVVGEDEGEAQQVLLVAGDQVRRLAVSLPDNSRITALRIAPDGVRVAAVITRSGGVQSTGLMRLDRTDEGRLSGFRSVALTVQQTATLTLVDDLVWSSPTQLVLLAAETEDSPLRPYRMSQDGLGLVGLGSQDNWRLTRLAAALRQPATTSDMTTEKLAAVGRDGTVWRYDDNLIWSPVAAELQTVAYPGG